VLPAEKFRSTITAGEKSLSEALTLLPNSTIQVLQWADSALFSVL